MARAAAVVAGFLRVEEAEMLTELLSSAGIEAWFEGAIASCLGPLIPGAGGGATLLVSPAHAERARDVIAASGLLGGLAPGLEDAAAPLALAGRPALPVLPVLLALGVVAATVVRLLLG